MKIFGAGMAGLLAGTMLRRYSPVVHEAQASLPNNHAALLRFRSDVVAKSTNIPFKKVKVNKLIAHAGKLYDRPNLKLSNMYSQKVTGKVAERSISSLEAAERYIAPDNFISELSTGVKVEYNSPLTKKVLEDQFMTQVKGIEPQPIISTIPMNMLMDMVGWNEKPEFNYKPIWSVWAQIMKPEIDVYQTIYYPDCDSDYYRVSITGNIIIAEYSYNPRMNIEDCSIHELYNPPPAVEKELLHILAREFGIHSVALGPIKIKEQRYGKLLPIDEKARKKFILYMSDHYRVYSLGRFATWRQLLLDDISNDISVIDKMVEHRDDYGRKLFNLGG